MQAAGETLSLGEQIALAALMIPTSKGAAGITGAGLVTLVASLQAFGGTFSTPEAIAVGIALVGWHRPDHARAGPHVEEATDRALRGEEIDHRRVGGGRFEREREAEPANA